MKQSTFIFLSLVAYFSMASIARAEDGTSEAVPLDQDMVADTITDEVSAAAEPKKDDSAPKPDRAVVSRVVAEQVESKAQIPADGVISTGERVSIDGKGFTIIAPLGWVVRKNLPRTSLLMQAPVNGTVYPRNIAVVRFKEPKYITPASAQEFADHLVASFPQVSSTIEGYSLRSHEPIKMADGRDGWMFYTEYLDSGRKMMQAHVLVSSQTNHYLATFTDVAEHFEGGPNGEQFLTEAWTAMTSIELDSATPSSGFGIRVMVIALIGVGTLMLLSTVARKILAKRYYRSVADSTEADEVSGITSEVKSQTVSRTLSPAVSGVSSGAIETDYSEEVIDEIVEATVRSGFSKIVNLRSKAVSTTPDDEEIDFKSQEKSTSQFKRGA